MARKAREYWRKDEAEIKSSAIYKTAIYARISVEREEKKSESIENQIEIIKSYIGNHPELSDYREYIDRGYSGTTFQRPAFEELMQDIKEGRINVIIVKDLSRFGRNDLETSNYLETILPFMQVRFISVNDNYDSDTADNAGKSMEIALKNLVNDMYAKDISKKVYSSRRSDMERGVFLGREAPYGYRIDEEDKMRRFLIDEPAAGVVREIYSKALDGKSMRMIAAELTEEGYSIPAEYKKTQNLMKMDGNGKDWHIGTISVMLKDPVYLGTLTQGKRVSRLFNGEKRHKAEEDEHVVIENAHEPIISRDVYDQVRDLLGRKMEDTTFNGDSGKWMKIKENKYSGILYCGVCGRKLQRASEIRAGKGRKYRNYYFRCSRGTTQSLSGACRTRITEKTLDEVLFNSLSNIAASLVGDVGIDKYHEHAKEIIRNTESAYRKRRQLVVQKIEGCRNEKMDFFRQYAEGELSREEYIEKDRRLQEEIDAYSGQLREADSLFAEETEKLEKIIRWCDTFLQCRSPRKDRKSVIRPELLRILVKSIRVLPGHVIEVDIPIRREQR